MDGIKDCRLKLQDLYQCPSNDCGNILVKQLESHWQQELLKPNPSFTKALIHMFKWEWIKIIILPFNAVCCDLQ